ncbi:MAG: FmdE family protein [Acidimicrobiales bacterium]
MIDTETTRRIVDFHGHMCPGLAMGIRAAEVALAEIGPHSVDEEVVAVVENDMCGVDAIQFLTGCTFGKGNLIHLDYGKNAYTFVRRADGAAIRISGRLRGAGVPASGDTPGNEVPGDGRERSPASMQERSEAILAAPIDELYEVRTVDAVVPPTARVFASLDCGSCGEATMETRIHLLDGHQLCPPCFERAVAQD